jgi:hypothetical protein
MMTHEHDTIQEVKPEVTAEPIPAGHDYDTPPKQWVAGTVVPKDTAPEDMTESEYVQWMYENYTPFWAIKKNLLVRYPPKLSGLEPSTAAIGDPSFELKVSGTGFVMYESVIIFAGQEEPTQLNPDGTVSTGVNMGVWHGADTVQVSVRNGSQVSEPLEFTFTAAAEEDTRGGKKEFKDYPPQPEHDEHDDNGKKAKKKK